MLARGVSCCHAGTLSFAQSCTGVLKHLQRQHMLCLQALLEAGADAGRRGRALEMAAAHGRGGAMQALLAAGAAEGLGCLAKSGILAAALSKGVRGGFLSRLLPPDSIPAPDLRRWAVAVLPGSPEAVFDAAVALGVARGRLPPLVLDRIIALLCCVA